MAADPVRLTAAKRAIPTPPKHLSLAMRRWWVEILEAFELDTHHLKLLETACGEWDRAQQARAELEANGGPTFLDRFGQTKEHPAAHIENQALILFARLVRELGLDLESPTAPRPPSRWHT